ncbi:MAG: outer membrane lipoprotein-sorting protein [Marinilabiliaceae bacterium]|nr:outer membrane lipoprotein-sorting protein [Marinilabiliaceae bacterium]
MNNQGKTKTTIVVFSLFLVIIGLFNSSVIAQKITANIIIAKANELMQGNSSYSEMSMIIERPKWKREIRLKGWSKGTEYSLIYITYPAKEKGQVFLKRGKEMWNYIPTIERMVKLPPSMMMQSWMGSDMTNDDLVKGASIVDDYDHSIIKEETIDGYDCYVLQLVPKDEAAVVWGKIVSWVSKKGFMTLRNEYYDEDEILVNVETLSNIRNVGDRIMPTHLEIVPVEKPNQKTILEFQKIEFEVPLHDDFFSIQKMKTVR